MKCILLDVSTSQGEILQMNYTASCVRNSSADFIPDFYSKKRESAAIIALCAHFFVIANLIVLRYLANRSCLT